MHLSDSPSVSVSLSLPLYSGNHNNCWCLFQSGRETREVAQDRRQWCVWTAPDAKSSFVLTASVRILVAAWLNAKQCAWYEFVYLHCSLATLWLSIHPSSSSACNIHSHSKQGWCWRIDEWHGKSRLSLYINVNILFASSLIIRKGDVTVVVLVRSVSRIDSSRLICHSLRMKWNYQNRRWNLLFVFLHCSVQCLWWRRLMIMDMTFD